MTLTVFKRITQKLSIVAVTRVWNQTTSLLALALIVTTVRVDESQQSLKIEC